MWKLLPKPALLAGTIFFLALPVGASHARNDPHKIVGPNACAECHKYAAQVWRGTHHFSTFRELPRSRKAREIADRMGMRRIKGTGSCLDCHFTVRIAHGRREVIAGVSCESCHSAAADWNKVHSSFSGKKKETETPAEARARWAKAEAAGMIRPYNVYGLAKNCYACHVVPDEKLVNVGGHPAGSAFDLVAWSQGEVRHNLWYSDGKVNRPASPSRKRLMFVTGVAVELATALRAVGKATELKTYAIAMARRAAAARATAAKIARRLPGIPELAEIVAASHSAGLKLHNEAALTAAADRVDAAIKRLAGKYDGSTFAAIDPMLPGPEKYKGKPAR